METSQTSSNCSTCWEEVEQTMAEETSPRMMPPNFVATNTVASKEAMDRDEDGFRCADEDEDVSLPFYWEYMPQAPPTGLSEIVGNNDEDEEGNNPAPNKKLMNDDDPKSVVNTIVERDEDVIHLLIQAEKEKEEETEEERIAKVDERIEKEYFRNAHGSFPSLPDYDLLYKQGDVEAYLSYLPKWIFKERQKRLERERVNEDYYTYDPFGRVTWDIRPLPSSSSSNNNGFPLDDPRCIFFIRRMGQILNDTTNQVTISLHSDFKDLTILEHILPTLKNVTSLTLERPSSGGLFGRGARFRSLRLTTTTTAVETSQLGNVIQGLQFIKSFSWLLPEIPTLDVYQAILQLENLEKFCFGRYEDDSDVLPRTPPTPEILQQLIEKKSLTKLSIKQKLSSKEYITAIINGLNCRNRATTTKAVPELEYESIRLDIQLLGTTLEEVLHNLEHIFFVRTCGNVEPSHIHIDIQTCVLTIVHKCASNNNNNGIHGGGDCNVVGRTTEGQVNNNDLRLSSSSQFLQGLVQKESLKSLCIQYSIPNHELLMAATDGLRYRHSRLQDHDDTYVPPLEHLSLTVDHSVAITSMNDFLLDLGYIIATGKVQTARISVRDNLDWRTAFHQGDDCILDMPRVYRGGGRVPALWIRPSYQGRNIVMASWKEWLPYLCFTLGISTIDVLGFDGCPAGCEIVCGIVSKVPIYKLQIDMTHAYVTSTGYLDMSCATRYLKRIAFDQYTHDKGNFRRACWPPRAPRTPILLSDKVVRLAFPSSIHKLRFGRESDRESILVSIEYITKVLSQSCFPFCNNYDNPSQLKKLIGNLPEDFMEDGTDDDVNFQRKVLCRRYLDAAWKHCNLEDLNVRAKKRLGPYSSIQGAIQTYDDDTRNEVECMLKLNQAGRSYVYNPNRNHWWSGMYTMASVQKLLHKKPELQSSAIYFLLQEDPALVEGRR